jgi:hypothetical protein
MIQAKLLDPSFFSSSTSRTERSFSDRMLGGNSPDDGGPRVL